MFINTRTPKTQRNLWIFDRFTFGLSQVLGPYKPPVYSRSNKNLEPFLAGLEQVYRFQFDLKSVTGLLPHPVDVQP
jgi:hypothetical protein